MVFRSNVDRYFRNFILIVVLIIAASTFWPLFLEGGSDVSIILLWTSIFIIVIGFLLWTTFSIQYIFYQDYLFLQGGPFRSRIPYEDITKVSPTTAIFTGYRILSSRNGIEIFYKNSAMGSVKISPKDKKGFTSELKRRCVNTQIQT